MARHNNSGGFVLVELVIGMVILGIIMAAIYGALSPTIRSYNYNMSRTNSLQTARNALVSIEDLVRYNAASITTPAQGDSKNKLDFTDSASNSYSISVPSSSGTDANTIVISKNGAAVSRLAIGMIQQNGLTFTRDTNDASKLTITLTVNDNAYAGSPGTTLTSLIILANM